MYLINNISSDPNQQQTVVLPDGSSFTYLLDFYPMQLGWFLSQFTYGSFTIYGLRVCVSPNMLYQFKNSINFGLACFTTQKREPTQQQDFSSGAFNLYVLTAAEVAAYTSYLAS